MAKLKVNIQKVLVVLSCLCVLCCSFVVPASAYSAGDGLPRPNEQEQVVVPLTLSFTYLDSSNDVHWVTGYPVALTINRNYDSFSSDIIINGERLGSVLGYLNDTHYVVHFEFYPITYNLVVASRYPFMPGANDSFGIFASENRTFQWNANYFTYSESLTDDHFNLQWSEDDTGGNITNVATQPVYKQFVDFIPSNSLVTYFTIYQTNSSQSANLNFFQLQLPTVTFSEYHQQFYDFFHGLDYDIERNPTYETIVTEFPTDWTSWLADSVAGFMSFEFAPGLSFGLLFASVFGVLMLWFLLHLFM